MESPSLGGRHWELCRRACPWEHRLCGVRGRARCWARMRRRRGAASGTTHHWEALNVLVMDVTYPLQPKGLQGEGKRMRVMTVVGLGKGTGRPSTPRVPARLQPAWRLPASPMSCFLAKTAW